MATPTSLPATFVAGNVLTAAQMNDLRGAFRILQVVSTTKTDTFSASLALAAVTDVTGLSATITPSSATSKVLVMATVHAAGGSTNVYSNASVILKRDSTQIALGDTDGSRTVVTAAQLPMGQNTATALVNTNFHYLDSPATTSATTYQIELCNSIGTSSTQTLYVNRSDANTNTSLQPRPVSTITVIEVSA